MEKALIIIDMLNDFIDPKGALYCGPTCDAIVELIRRRSEAHRRRGGVVIYLQDSHRPDDAEFAKFPVHCVAGTWGSRIIESLTPFPSDIVLPKTRYSGFYGTDLEKVLLAAHPEGVEVVGVCTSICVMDTVGGLVNRDYAVRVPAVEVADFDPQAHAFALRRMQTIYGARIV